MKQFPPLSALFKSKSAHHVDRLCAQLERFQGKRILDNHMIEKLLDGVDENIMKRLREKTIKAAKPVRRNVMLMSYTLDALTALQKGEAKSFKRAITRLMHDRRAGADASTLSLTAQAVEFLATRTDTFGGLIVSSQIDAMMMIADDYAARGNHKAAVNSYVAAMRAADFFGRDDDVAAAAARIEDINKNNYKVDATQLAHVRKRVAGGRPKTCGYVFASPNFII